MKKLGSLNNSAQKGPIKPIEQTLNFTPSDPNHLQAGMQIIHSKFGQGKILTIDGSPSSQVATIFFPKQGQKKIMLKYAQLQIVE
jgi:DNA helicase-2/ATP-dependent DNA helicase PcrA